MPNAPSFLVALAFGGAVGAAAGGAPLLLGAVNQRVSPARRGLATGIVSAGGSAGQFTLAPASQAAIAATGWMNAMLLGALLTLAVIPLARAFRARSGDEGEPGATARAPLSPASRAAVRRAALRDPYYWLVTAGFSICGFHVSFLATHMPGVIELCGMPPSLAGTWLAIRRLQHRRQPVSGMMIQDVDAHMLMALHAGRAAGVLCFLLAPKTPAVMLLFAVWMGVSYMAVLPPTAGLIARRYGAANLSTLLGLTMLFHQIGSFLGVWLGGVVFEASGHYDWMWRLDIALALAAVAVHLPLRGAPSGRCRARAPA